MMSCCAGRRREALLRETVEVTMDVADGVSHPTNSTPADRDKKDAGVDARRHGAKEEGVDVEDGRR